MVINFNNFNNYIKSSLNSRFCDLNQTKESIEAVFSIGEYVYTRTGNDKYLIFDTTKYEILENPITVNHLFKGISQSILRQ